MYARLPTNVAVGASAFRNPSLGPMTGTDLTEPSPRFQIKLVDARARQCRFIASSDVGEAVCCGAPTSETSSWCAWHRQVVFVPRQGERDRRRAA
jgi:hypothetical protein